MEKFTVVLNHRSGSHKSDVEAPDALVACEIVEARFRASYTDLGFRYTGGLDIRIVAIDGVTTPEEAKRQKRSAK